MTRHTTFALFGNAYQQAKSAAIQQVLQCLQAHGATIRIEEEYHRFLLTTGLIDDRHDMETFCGSDFEADFALSMGGDGTLLKTASQVRDRQPLPLRCLLQRLGTPPLRF